MDKMKHKIIKAAKIYLIVSGIVLNGLLIYYAPVIDRIVLRPCHHYPDMFIDCKEEQ